MVKTTIYTKAQRLLSDTLTPIGLFLNLRDRYPSVSLFESSDYASKTNAHSFIGVQPIATVCYSNGKVSVRVQQKLTYVKPLSKAAELDEIMGSFVFDDQKNAHQNGFFGVIGYDAVPLFEEIELKKVNQSTSDLPAIFLAVYRYVLVFDHFHHQLTVMSNALKEGDHRMDDLLKSLRQVSAPSGRFRVKGQRTSSETDRSFKEKVTLAKQHVARGDVFQLVLSRQFRQPFEGDDFEVYRQLRTINPSPYLFYFDLEKARLMGASPEAQIKITSRLAEIHPIAGTIQKREDPEENRQRIAALQQDEKENAEHIMLVDLARNDLNRYCTEVTVDRLKEVQSFSHVIHLVSKVSGKLEEKRSRLEVFGGSFPAGTLSGTPKYRAMQLIDDYEVKHRAYYGGAIGLLAANGDVNMAIVIRTACSHNGALTYQAGAGIVHDSTPDGECREVYNKVKAVETAIQKAQQDENNPN